MKQALVAVRRILVPAVVVIGALGFSSVAMAASRAGSPASDGTGQSSATTKSPHSVMDSMGGHNNASHCGCAVSGARAGGGASASRGMAHSSSGGSSAHAATTSHFARPSRSSRR